MDSVLVTGGTTFTSRAMARHLIGVGYDVDILSRGKKTADYTGFREHILCDRRNPEEIKKALSGKRYRFVFDICAYTGEDVRLLLSALDTGGVEKYILCSSGAVYPPSDEKTDETEPTGENPNWGKYGTDKIEAECTLVASGVPHAIFRPTYIYGEGNNLYRESYFFDRLTQGKTIPVPFGKNARTQFVYIDDLVRLFESASRAENCTGVFNLTHPEEVTWEGLIAACAEAAGKTPVVKRIDVRESEVDPKAYFPLRDVTYLLDISKLRMSGLRPPQISLAEGLKRCYAWYLREKPAMANPRMNMVDILSEQ